LLTKKEANRLPVFKRKVLTIYGPKIVDGVHRSRYNFELDREFTSPNVIGDVKSNRFRYVGHMLRGAEDLPQRTLYRAIPEGRRNQRRPTSRWTDGVNSDIKTLGSHD
jgi:hypothetical protein